MTDGISSVADLDPGSGAFLTQDPGSGIGFSRILDLDFFGPKWHSLRS
jgi:hypothetical protein